MFTKKENNEIDKQQNKYIILFLKMYACIMDTKIQSSSLHRFGNAYQP
jgi:hypothetical protein